MVDSLIATFLTQWFDLFNPNSQERKHFGKTWSVGLKLSRFCEILSTCLCMHSIISAALMGSTDNKMITLVNIKKQSISLFKLPQVFRYTLYLHCVQKLASISYSSLPNQKPWSYLHCHQIKEKCFRKYDNHKKREILYCDCKNNFLQYTFWKLRGFCDLCTGFDTGTLLSLPTLLSHQFSCVHKRTRFSFISER